MLLCEETLPTSFDIIIIILLSTANALILTKFSQHAPTQCYGHYHRPKWKIMDDKTRVKSSKCFHPN
jgi:hypothetical protein